MQCGLPILLETPDLLVLDKPPLCPSAPRSPHDDVLKDMSVDSEVSLKNLTALHHGLARLNSPLSPHGQVPHKDLVKMGPREQPALLHRLDTPTSGVLALARNPPAYEFYRSRWNTPEVVKIYRALVRVPPSEVGSLSALEGQEIRFPLAHSAKTKGKMVAPEKTSEKYRGKLLAPRTEIQTITLIQDPHIAQITLRIRTGVHHQIRAHLAYSGYPILGDELYDRQFGKGPSFIGEWEAQRLFLHAWRLRLPYRSQDKKKGGFLIESPLPISWPSQMTTHLNVD